MFSIEALDSVEQRNKTALFLLKILPIQSLEKRGPYYEPLIHKVSRDLRSLRLFVHKLCGTSTFNRWKAILYTDLNRSKEIHFLLLSANGNLHILFRRCRKSDVWVDKCIMNNSDSVRKQITSNV